MTLWNTKELSNQLRYGSLPEKERMKYFLLQAVMVVIVTSKAFMYTSVRPIKYEYIGDFVIILITIVGTVLAFRQNEKGDNHNFVDRVICLSIPIFMRIFAVGFLLSPVLMILPIDQETFTGKIFFTVFTVLFEAIFYWRLWLWMGRTSGAQA